MAVTVIREPKNFPCDGCACDASGRSTTGDTWTIDGVLEDSPVCPRRLITAQSIFFLDLYQHYQRGVLPVAGGLLDQPRLYYQAMTIIDHWTNKLSERSDGRPAS